MHSPTSHLREEPFRDAKSLAAALCEEPFRAAESLQAAPGASPTCKLFGRAIACVRSLSEVLVTAVSLRDL